MRCYANQTTCNSSVLMMCAGEFVCVCVCVIIYIWNCVRDKNQLPITEIFLLVSSVNIMHPYI